MNGPRDVAIGYVRPQRVDGAFCDCLAAAIAYDGIEGGRHLGARIVEISGPRITAGRNNVVRSFLQGSWPWLCMVDTDVTFPEDVLDNALARAQAVDTKVYAGLYFTGGNGGLHLPSFGYASRDDHGHLAFEWPLQLPEHATMVPADVVGAGFLLVHRSVLVEVGRVWAPRTVHPWFEESQQKPCPHCHFAGSDLGEDVVFSLRVTAAGAPIIVDLELELGHRKTHTLDRATFTEQGAGLAVFGEEELLRRERQRIGLAT